MTRHVGDDVLRRFVDGDMDDNLATEVALHLDECPECANRANLVDPLASAFAAVEDPPLPLELASRVEQALAQVSSPVARRPDVLSPVLGGVLFAAAAVLLWLGGDPFPLVRETFTGLWGVVLGVQAVAHAMPALSLVLVGLGIGILAASVATFHLLDLSREAA